MREGSLQDFLSTGYARALRTRKTERLERELGPDYHGPPITTEFGSAKDLCFGGDMESSIALTGQVAGRISSVKPVAEIIAETMADFHETARAMGARYG